MKLWIFATATIVVMASSSVNAALIERLGGLAYYDNVADLTWLADANYAQTSGYDSDGRMNWADANSWAAGLSVGGVDGWRLPSTIDVGNDGGTYANIFQGVDYGFNILTDSEMSNMYYNVLGNLAIYDTEGAYLPSIFNTGQFINLMSYYYWSSTEYVATDGGAWGFVMGNHGYQGDYGQPDEYYAWAVKTGDVSAVPVPAAVWLFGSGLIGLVGFARRKVNT